MSSSSSAADVAVACRDPECVDETGNRSVAEPEQDGDLRFHQCATCGYAFGYQQLTQGAQSEGSCAVGIPEDIRRRASAAMTNSIAAQTGPLLQIGRRPDAPAP